MDQLEFGPALREDEVVRQTLVILEEVILDIFALVSQAEHEVIVPEMSVVFHEMPDDRAVADIDHRLGNLLGIVAQPHAESAAEENDFHGSISGFGKVTCVISSALRFPSPIQGQLLINLKFGDGNHESTTPVADV